MRVGDIKSITIDFETRSTVPIEKGLKAYMQGMEVLCMAFKSPDKEPEILVKKEAIKRFCKSLESFSKKGLIVAHNTPFEFMVVKTLTDCSDELFFKFIDTALLSRFFSGPFALDACGPYWDLKNKKGLGKDLINVLSSPYGPKTPKEVRGILTADHVKKNGFVEHERLFYLLGAYCKQDIKVTEELFNVLMQKVYCNRHQVADIRRLGYINFLRNNKGIRFDIPLVKVLKKETFKLPAIYQKKAQQITKNKNFNLNSSFQVLDFLRSKGINVSKTGAASLNPIKEKTKDPSIKSFIDLRLNRPEGKEKNFEKILELSEDSVITDSVCLYGAYTGRYTGMGIGPLNFPRNKGSLKECLSMIKNKTLLKTKKVHTYKYLLHQARKTIIPFPGEVFYCCDFSAIEFRLALLVAGEKKSLKKLLKGADFYKYMASRVFNKPLSKVSKEERYIAKRAVLARDYGLGIVTFKSIMAEDSIFLEDSKARELLAFHDKSFPLIKKKWYEFFEPFSRVQKGKIIDELRIGVPFSRRNLYYRKVQRIVDKEGREQVVYLSSRGKGFYTIYPSKLFGHIIQSLALDVFHEAEIRLFDELRIKAVIPLHDEFLCSVNPKKIKEKKFLDVVRKTPYFLDKKFIPYLDVDFWKGERYEK